MTPAVAVFVLCFAVVAVLGLLALRWRRPANLLHLDEWGLGGRSLGVWLTWFLVGGEFYTAYTVVAVPALVFATGAYGFFALPYATLLYPVGYIVLPRLWRQAAAAGHVTAADIAGAAFNSRAVELVVAVTGILSTMPYIALQLVGMQAALRALGFAGDWPLAAAFAILALYTYAAGLRAPALIAVLKDVMIWIVVLAAIIILPLRLGGYGHVFAAAADSFAKAGKPQAMLLTPGQIMPFASLILGSTFASFLYPQTMTGVFAAASPEIVRRNMVLLPAYSVILGLLAMLGLVARAEGLHPAHNADVVPALFIAGFPPWFAGFALATIAIGALVPAAVMSIGSANLYSRNIAPLLRRRRATPKSEAQEARLASLLVKIFALLAVLFLPTQFAIDLQLLGGLWVVQTLPSVVGALRPKGLNATGLLAGWAVGMGLGSALAFTNGLKPVVALFGLPGLYAGLIAVLANIAVAYAVSALEARRAARLPSAASGPT